MLEKILKKSLVLGTILAGTTIYHSCEDSNTSRITSDTLNQNTNESDIFDKDTNKNSLNNCEKVYFIDQDGDNFGYKSLPIYSCEPLEGYSDNFLDCEDNNFDINPSTKEICNGLDDNCNGIIDEGFTLSVWYYDEDGDGFGNEQIKLCNQPIGYVKESSDCDDLDKNINPGLDELCDKKDNDCDGLTDEELLKECSNPCGKGIQECIDGAYTKCSISAKPEICDGIDNNCNGETDEGLEFTTWYQDDDNDGFGDNNTNPIYDCKQPEDLINLAGDCNDSNQEINPSMEEICNGIDDNCDGLIDLKFSNEICNTYDFIFVIDNSGSMDGNDPNDIRYIGLKDLVNGLWNQSDNGLIIPFAAKQKIIGPFASDKETLLSYIDTAKNTDVGWWNTYIGFAIDTAIEQFQLNNQKRAIILLTDGESSNDIPITLLNQEAGKKNIEICALGLGNSVNMVYLDTLTSGIGKSLHIDTANQIPEFFQKSYLALKCQSWLQCSVDNEWVTKTGKCGVD